VIAGCSARHDQGRPDAWIWCDESFAVFLETKVRGAANADQIERHIRGAEGWGNADVRRESRSWSDIYDFFVGVQRNQSGDDSTTRLLLDEFVRYLRMIGLASDTTFDLDDFGYFLLRPEDRDEAIRELLMRKLRRFSEELLRSAAMRTVVKRYGGRAARLNDFVSPGVFRKDSDTYWITIGPKKRRNTCHFTVRLSEEGISLEAFSPHKSFTTAFVKKIAARPEAFIGSLKAMKAKHPYFIRLREAYYYDPHSPYKGQRISGRTDFLQIHPQVVSAENLSQLIIEPVEQRLTDPKLRPEIFLVRHFRLSELVGKSQVVDLVSSAAESMLDYLDFAIDLSNGESHRRIRIGRVHNSPSQL
jgi:hypothetical protein